MKTPCTIIGIAVVGLLAGFLSGCAHSGKETNTFFPGPFTSGGVTYYPAHPGTINYDSVDYTTNQPPAGVRPFVTVVTTNAHWRVKLIDGPGSVSTNIPSE